MTSRVRWPLSRACATATITGRAPPDSSLAARRSPPPSRRAADRRGASRQSRIIGGTTLVRADLHSHTLLSDGDGDPALAFDSVRAAGLDVEGKGRTGLWVTEHTRAGVKAAMLSRRFFATRTSGLRVDATASRSAGWSS